VLRWRSLSPAPPIADSGLIDNLEYNQANQPGGADMAGTRVAVVAFDRIRPLHLSVPCAVFGEPPGPGAPLFDLRVCAAEPGELRTQAGFSISTQYGLSALDWADVVVVPSWRDPQETPPRPLLDALRRANARGALVVGLCLGAY